MHGDRTAGGTELTLDTVRERIDGDPEASAERFRAARAEWSATIDALREVDGVGVGPLGYWGLSMGTVIGLPFVASEPRIDAAVLGLMGVPENARGRAAASITMPILFLVQWDDELVDRNAAFRLFGALASEDKTMHANPGAHAAVPAYEIQASEEFFAKHLGAKVGGPPPNRAAELAGRTEARARSAS
jgi:dienelactone hydrolase